MKNSPTLKYSTSYTLPKVKFTRKGYSFVEWNTKKDGTGTSIVNKAVVKKLTTKNNKTVILYARWTKIKYEIKYYLNGGINSEENPSYYKITDTITLANPIKEGCTFKGWYLDSNFKTKSNTIAKGSTGVKEFYAKWSNNILNINYELNGGVNNSNNINTFTIDEEVSLYEPTRKGYTFDGWFTEDTFDNKIEKIEIGTSRDITLYAKWNPISYSIIYNLNDGVNNSNNVISYTIEDEITLFNPSKDGYSFYGWFTENTFENEMSVINKGTTGDITLYAKWGDIRYNIIYELDGGVNNPDNAIYFSANDEIILLSPSKDGYDFDGWYDDEVFTNKITKISEGTTEDVTIYAKWNIKNYQIDYHLNGGTNNPNNVTSYTVLDNITLYEPTRSGYDFDGWMLDGIQGESISEIVVGTTGTIHLYAKWNPKVFHIYYVLDGGTNSSYNPDTFTPNESVFLHTPSKSGFLFSGWYLDPEFTQNITEIPVFTDHDVTVYVRWNSANSYDDAIDKAQEYLNERAYSYEMLLFALKDWEGFSDEAALYAVDNCGANWNEQASKRAVELENSTPYSSVKLKYALENYEMFTSEEAQYAIENAEINWNNVVQRFAFNAINTNSYTYDELVEYMMDEGFTYEQAIIGADYVFQE